MKLLPPLFALCLSFSLMSCTAPFHLQASVPNAQKTVRASLVSSSGGQSLRVIDLSQLPSDLQQSTQIQAIVDNSNTTYNVLRNADGSLSIPLPSGRRPDSEGMIELLLSNAERSWLLRFDTGSLLDLNRSAIGVSPRSQVVLGTDLTLSAKLKEGIASQDYVFNWSVSSSSSGPFQNLSGTSSSISWEPMQSGNYFVRLEMRDPRTGANSSFTSSAPLVFVQAPDKIVLSEPVNGQISSGETIRLTANLPEWEGQESVYLWSYSLSPQVPFQPIAAQGSSINWEPPASGSYYLRLQVGDNTYTSSKALVFVSNADEIFRTEPASGSLTRGQSLRLQTSLSFEPTSRLLWSYSTSPQGPFNAIAAEGQNTLWLPDNTGEFYLRLRILTGDSEKTYTSSKVLVRVQDSDSPFLLTPNPARLLRGQSVNLRLNMLPADRTLNWYWGFSSQGPFQAIAGQGQDLRWTPPLTGSFYLRAELSGSGQALSSFTSASALVTVSDGLDLIQSNPSGIAKMGSPVQLQAQLPDMSQDAAYTWSYGFSPVGPWLPAQSFDESGPRLNWYPSQEGAFYLKVDVARPDNQSITSFVSPRVLVSVNSSRDFFRVSPQPAVIGTQGAVVLDSQFQPVGTEQYTYIWSAGLSPQGPFTALGAGSQSRFTWLAPGRIGAYYLKLDVIAQSSRKRVSFVSAEPLVQVTESQGSTGAF